MRTIRLLILLVFITTGFIPAASAQITGAPVSVSLSAVEDSFLVKNYLLLAQRFRIDANKALVRQAKIWDNPRFSGVFGFGTTKRIQPFKIDTSGEAQYDIDQLIQLAGKRNKSIRLAASAVTLSEAAFDELVRSLRLQLRQQYYNIYFLQQTGKVLKAQLGNLQTIVDAYATADKKGSVAHADLVRLQALMVALENDYADNKQNELDAQKTLQQLLHSHDFYIPEVTPVELTQYKLDSIQLPQLLADAATNRPDVRMAAAQYESAELNYRLQKAMAVPDLTVGATYDKQGNYTRDFIGLKIGVDLPFWNRNQGNIRAAQMQVGAVKQEMLQQQNIAQTEVLNAYHTILQLDKRYKGFDLGAFQQEYNQLIAEVAKNFSKGNISLLQFIDYFNSYSDNAKNINKFLSDRVKAYEELNYATGQTLFNKL